MHGALKRTDALSGNIFYSKSIVNLSMTANQSEYATIINSLVMAIKSGLFGLLNLGNGPRRKAKEKEKQGSGRKLSARTLSRTSHTST